MKKKPGKNKAGKAAKGTTKGTQAPPTTASIMIAGRAFAATLKDLASEIGAPSAAALRSVANVDGCPGREKKSKLFDVEKWAAFWDDVKHRLEEITATDNTEGQGKGFWDIRKAAAQAKILELQESERRGELVGLEEATQSICELIKLSKEQLSQVPQAMAADLTGLSLPEFAKRLKEVHREALEKIYNGLAVKKKRFWRTLYARLCGQHPKSSLGLGQNGG